MKGHRAHTAMNLYFLKSGRCITQLAKMSIDPKFIELTADVLNKRVLYLKEFYKIY